MFKFLVAAAMLAGTAVPAAAVTVVVDQSANTTNVPFYQTSQTVTLSAGFTNAKINIGTLSADDLAIVYVNGTAVAGAGIFGPGNGNVYLTAAGGSTPYTFAYNNGVINASFSAPFVTGANVISVLVNNNNAGINTGNGPLTGGPGSLTFTGTVTYDAAATVPEPASWALLIGGFALTGAAMRRRSAALAA